MGLGFSQAVNKGLDYLYNESPQKLLRRYELVLEAIPRFQDTVYNERRYETWHRYVTFRNLLRRQLERLQVNAMLSERGTDVDIQSFDVQLGAFNDTFPRHRFSWSLLDDVTRIEWFNDEVPETIKVFVLEHNIELDGTVETVLKPYTLSRFSRGKELWDMVEKDRKARGRDMEYSFPDGPVNKLKLWSRQGGPSIFYNSERPLTRLEVEDGYTFIVSS